MKLTRPAFFLVSCIAFGWLTLGGAAGCRESLFLLSGTVTGLSGGTLLLTNDDIDDVSVTEDGTFTFNGLLHNGDDYNVFVKEQPTGQTCTVTNGSGTVEGKNILDIEVDCN